MNPWIFNIWMCETRMSQEVVQLHAATWWWWWWAAAGEVTLSYMSCKCHMTQVTVYT